VFGRGRIVVEDYIAAEVKINYMADNFACLDRFGRVIDQVWTDYGANPDVAIDEYIYTYDRAGNRLSKENVVSKNQGTPVNLDETYEYDELDRLTEWTLGGSTQKTWTLDSLGNDLSAGSYSAANEETPTGMNGSPYDAAGNMTTLKSGKTAVYDAWNRLVEVDNGSNIVEKYEYDGTGRRIRIYSDFSGGTPPTTAALQDDYYSGRQVVESDKTTGYNLATKTGTAAGGYQYIWSPRYIDSLIIRDTLATDRSAILTGDRLIYLSDANYNVTGLVKYDSGTGQWQVVERYTYNPYGVVTVRYGNDGAGMDWSERTAGTAYSNTILFSGRFYDIATALYYYRARFQDPLLERFINRDPIKSDWNLYRYVLNNPINATDPTGNTMSLGCAKALATETAAALAVVGACGVAKNPAACSGAVIALGVATENVRETCSVDDFLPDPSNHCLEIIYWEPWVPETPDNPYPPWYNPNRPRPGSIGPGHRY
jgi:RHS repeat-associated protein